MKDIYPVYSKAFDLCIEHIDTCSLHHRCIVKGDQIISDTTLNYIYHFWQALQLHSKK